MKNLFRFLLMAAVCFAAVSCWSYKRLGYLQDMEEGISYSMPQQPEAHIAKGDKINIIVNCSTPELAAPFNVMNGIYTAPNSNGLPGIKVSDLAPGADMTGYEVDNEGNITYPILGILHIEGMTLKELKIYIENSIKERRLIKDPIVMVNFTNFKITILGEAGKGIYNIPEGKIDIFGALALSKDLTEDAVRDEVWVVRSREGMRQLYKINLKSKDCYYSPAFFLQQNDMIYAKPTEYKADSTSRERWTRAATIFTGVATILNLILWAVRGVR